MKEKSLHCLNGERECVKHEGIGLIGEREVVLHLCESGYIIVGVTGNDKQNMCLSREAMAVVVELYNSIGEHDKDTIALLRNCDMPEEQRIAFARKLNVTLNA